MEAHIILTPEKEKKNLHFALTLFTQEMKTLGLEGDVTYRLSKIDP